jgi:phosphomevalonate kinase
MSCGKAFIAGEYAVLFGKPALVLAIDRFAHCLPVKGEESSLVNITKEVCTKNGFVALHEHYSIDTADFYSKTSGKKLGLGSSAAAIVSLCKTILSEHKIFDQRLLLKLSMLAHDQFSLGQGSGADVAASVYGGLIKFQKGHEPIHLALPDLWPELLFIDTMHSQNTREFVNRVMKLKNDPFIKDFCKRSEALVEDFVAQKNRHSIFDELFILLKELGTKAQIPIISPEHQIIKDLANKFQGSAKPSGAGGGDLAIALIPKKNHEPFLQDLKDRGFEKIDLKPCPPIWP